MSRENRLNVQGLSRKEVALMGCIKASPGYVVISSDASAGEPSVTTHFTQDPMYRYATFDGIGKAPFYKNSILYIDDIYLMGCSVSPAHKSILQEAFNRPWPAGSFPDQWLADPDHVKSTLKSIRFPSKAAVLGFSYGMGAKKSQNTLYEQGFDISFQDCKQFHRNYWTLFSGLRAFSNQLARQVEVDGYLVNPFGYRGVPEPHKAFNFFIQSTVSGLMHVYLAKLAARAPYAELLTIIHDELLLQIPEDKAVDIQLAIKDATDSLNQDLGWTVNLRFGCAMGKDWYEAH